MENCYRCRYCTGHFDNAKSLSHLCTWCGPTMYQGQNDGNGYNHHISANCTSLNSIHVSSNNNIDSEEEVDIDDIFMEYDMSSVQWSVASAHDTTDTLQIEKVYVSGKYNTIENLLDIDLESDILTMRMKKTICRNHWCWCLFE